MANNVMQANFTRTHKLTVRGLCQWDYGQILEINGITLPDTFEVHFCNTGNTGTVTVIGSDGEVEIPNDLLTSGADIHAYIYLHEGADDGETEYFIRMPVINRPQPSDGDPTPTQQSAISQAIALLEQKLEQVDQYNLELNVSTQGGYLVLKKNDAAEDSITVNTTAVEDSTALITSGGAFLAGHKVIDNSLYKAESEQAGINAVINPYVYYRMGYPYSLRIRFPSYTVESACLLEYIFCFTSPSDQATQLNLPSNVLIPSGFEVQAGKTYEIVIANNLARISEW